MIAFCKRRIKNKNKTFAIISSNSAVESQHSYDVDTRSELDVNNQPIDNIDYVFDHGDPTQLLEGLSHKPSKFQNGGNFQPYWSGVFVNLILSVQVCSGHL
jgi:hypothetical protein